MKRLPLLCVLGLGSITSLVRAESSEGAWDGDYNQVASRRSGFVAGLTLGLAAGNAHGYPNELAKLGDPLYKRNTGGAFGGVNRLWFGGALTDYLVFGLGFAGMGVKHGETSAAGSAFIFHVEGYPLFIRAVFFATCRCWVTSARAA